MVGKDPETAVVPMLLFLNFFTWLSITLDFKPLPATREALRNAMIKAIVMNLIFKS